MGGATGLGAGAAASSAVVAGSEGACARERRVLGFGRPLILRSSNPPSGGASGAASARLRLRVLRTGLAGCAVGLPVEPAPVVPRASFFARLRVMRRNMVTTVVLRTVCVWLVRGSARKPRRSFYSEHQ